MKDFVTEFPDRMKAILIGVRDYFLTQPVLSALTGLAVFLLIVFFVLLGGLNPSAQGQQVPLNQVLDAAGQRQVQSAKIYNEDAQVGIVTRAGQHVYANYPKSEGETSQLINLFDKAGAQLTIDQQSGKNSRRLIVQFLLPILILVTLFTLFTLLAKGASSGASAFAGFSKFGGKGRKKGQADPDAITFKNVAGVPEALEELQEIVDFLENPGKYRLMGAAAPKGVLLVGPPGTGKTLLARATAGEAASAFFSASASEFVESLVGVGAARVRDLFKKAREMAPAIIFIDELDACGRQRGTGMGQGNDEREQTLNQLLVEMDGFGAELGITVMAATNRPDVLDPALLRPGRFDRQVVVDTPDVHGRAEILRLYSKSKPLGPDASMDRVAQMTPGFSGAELANVINEATLLAVRSARAQIEQEDLEEAIERVISGPQRRGHILSDREKELIATHEVSHAVVATAIGQEVAQQKISIVARGRNLGSAAVYTSADRLVLQREDLIMQLITIMAGAAGEELYFGQLSTGVEGDLDRATKLARSMVVSYGMSPQFGPISMGEKAGEVFLGRDIQSMGNTSPVQLELIDQEVRTMVLDSFEVAKAVIKHNNEAMEELVGTLIEQETLSGVALEALLSAVRPYDGDLTKPSGTTTNRRS
ncbi:MAG TPA: ATP-dependent zinc metalloprotease FtsH [Solirubrobacteraceae bacterium]|jgi:cell division protease FtsH|nr:ATP-dependent zinc metalloprotease FtsH [Solirubrobacteraceae bacterium]